RTLSPLSTNFYLVLALLFFALRSSWIQELCLHQPPKVAVLVVIAKLDWPPSAHLDSPASTAKLCFLKKTSITLHLTGPKNLPSNTMDLDTISSATILCVTGRSV